MDEDAHLMESICNTYEKGWKPMNAVVIIEIHLKDIIAEKSADNIIRQQHNNPDRQRKHFKAFAVQQHPTAP